MPNHTTACLTTLKCLKKQSLEIFSGGNKFLFFISALLAINGWYPHTPICTFWWIFLFYLRSTTLKLKPPPPIPPLTTKQRGERKRERAPLL